MSLSPDDVFVEAPALLISLQFALLPSGLILEYMRLCRGFVVLLLLILFLFQYMNELF